MVARTANFTRIRRTRRFAELDAIGKSVNLADCSRWPGTALVEHRARHQLGKGALIVRLCAIARRVDRALVQGLFAKTTYKAFMDVRSFLRVQ